MNRYDITAVPDERRCTEISEATGERCRAWARKGTTTCYWHSGANVGRTGKATPPPVMPVPDEYDVSAYIEAREARERDLRPPDRQPPPGFVWEREYENPDHPWRRGPRKILDEDGEVFRWVLVDFAVANDRLIQDKIVADGERRDREAEARNDLDRRLYHQRLMQEEDPRLLPTDYRDIAIPGLDPVPVDLDDDRVDRFVGEVVRQAIRG